MSNTAEHVSRLAHYMGSQDQYKAEIAERVAPHQTAIADIEAEYEENMALIADAIATERETIEESMDASGIKSLRPIAGLLCLFVDRDKQEVTDPEKLVAYLEERGVLAKYLDVRRIKTELGDHIPGFETRTTPVFTVRKSKK